MNERKHSSPIHPLLCRSTLSNLSILFYVDTTVIVTLCLFFYISFICSSGHWSLACLVVAAVTGHLRALVAHSGTWGTDSSEHFPFPTLFQ